MEKESFRIFLKKNIEPAINKYHVTYWFDGVHIENVDKGVSSLCSIYVDRSFIAKLGKNYLMRLLNESINHCMLRDTLITLVTEDEAGRIFLAAKDNRDSESGWLKVSKEVGMRREVDRDAENIEIEYICFDMEHNKYVKVTEGITGPFGLTCTKINDDILNRKKTHIRTKIEDYEGKKPKNFIATVDAPVTASLVLEGFPILASTKNKSSIKNVLHEEETEDKYKDINEKEALKVLLDTNVISIVQHLEFEYSLKTPQDNFIVFLDGQIQQIGAANEMLEKSSSTLEMKLDEKEHVLELSIGDFNKKIVIPPGITNEREISVQLRD